MLKIKLDRIAIEEVGLNPERLAAAIHVQFGDSDKPVPVEQIATALDIDEIRQEHLTNLEAALITTLERGYGKILLNKNSSRQRQRFSLAHELLHFLNPTHLQTADEGFFCSRSDMRAKITDTDRHLRQEAEANAFAIELLAPRSRLKSYLRGAPDLAKVIAFADHLDISRGAAARRFVELHPDNLAVIFCKDAQLKYFDCNKEFPRLSVKTGQTCNISKGQAGEVTDMDEVAADDWLSVKRGSVDLSAQTFFQAGGHSLTLLHAVATDGGDEDPGFDDAFERFDKFNR